MRMIVFVASGILTTCHHHDVVVHFLRSVGDDVSFTLLGHYAADVALLRLQVVGDFAGLVAVLAVFEHRPADPLVVDAVVHTGGVNLAAVGGHADKFARQLHLLVFQITPTVQVGRTVGHHHHRIVCLVVNRRFDILAGANRPLRCGRHTIRLHAICLHTIRLCADCAQCFLSPHRHRAE